MWITKKTSNMAYWKIEKTKKINLKFYIKQYELTGMLDQESIEEYTSM